MITQQEPRSRGKALQIRPADIADAPLMARWQQAMAQETEHKHLDGDTLRRGIELGVADPQRARYFLALRDGEPAGMLMLTREWSDWRCGWWWWIQSVYVAAEHRRQGVYRALYEHVLAAAKRDDEVCGLRLYVEKDNAAAQRTYLGLGMVDAGYLIYEAETR